MQLYRYFIMKVLHLNTKNAQSQAFMPKSKPSWASMHMASHAGSALASTQTAAQM
jgi:hypothetical protein